VPLYSERGHPLIEIGGWKVNFPGNTARKAKVPDWPDEQSLQPEKFLWPANFIERGVQSILSLIANAKKPA
jgi:hypothetical protein